MSGPRVVHVVPALFDGEVGVVGGAERYAFELARNMSHRTSTRLVTFGKRAESRQIGELRVEIVAEGRLLPGNPPQAFSFDLFDLLEGADVIHCHQLLHIATTLTAAYANRSGIPVFVTDLGGGPAAGDSHPDASTWFDSHLHISEFSRRNAQHSREERSEVIGAGVDASVFSPSVDPVDQARVLCVGRILPHKGMDTLIRALPHGMSLTIAGRPYDSRYHSDLCALAAGRNVTFITDADDEALVREYRRAAVVALPSVYTTMYGAESVAPELLGQTLLEGMACGKPTLCTDVGGMPEIVVDGETGFVVPPGDAASLSRCLEWVRDHPDDAREMGDRGRSRALRSFSWASVVDRCLDAYARSQSKAGLNGTPNREE